MSDLQDIYALAFGGGWAWCYLAAALASLLVSPKLRPSRVAWATFAACWAYPFVALAGAYDPATAAEAATRAVLSAPGDLVWLAARFGGIYLIIGILWRARLALHGRRPVARVEPKAA